jgi:hypothetical protein
VIDLGTGYAHQDDLDPSINQQIHFQRVAIEQQRFYESKIREILKDYPGIKISVHVDVNAAPEDNHVASIPSSIPAMITNRIAPLPTAGANSYATIEQALEPIGSVETLAIEFISHTSNASTPGRLDKQISVSIDVPQKLVHDLFGPPPSSSSFATSPSELQAKMASDIDSKFERLRAEIVQKVRPILPQSKRQDAAETPINVSLIRIPLPESQQWMAQAQDFAIQNWPSAAVLIIGLMLPSIVTRKPDAFEETANATATSDSGDILSIHSNSTGQLGSTENPEARLTQLIEKDPDAAARVIEAWIRDAA